MLLAVKRYPNNNSAANNYTKLQTKRTPPTVTETKSFPIEGGNKEATIITYFP